MYGKLKDQLSQELESIKEAGLYKSERVITTAQGAVIKTDDGFALTTTWVYLLTPG